mgnify:CR=1 FL=1
MKKAPLGCHHPEDVSRELPSEHREVVANEPALGFRHSAFETTAVAAGGWMI